MSKFTSPLNNVRIASPCSADWEEMYGDARKRYCGDCKLNVYNLSAMSRDEAENLITNGEGRLCVRFYQRADGTVITQDCPVGWAAVKHRAKVVTTAFFSLMIAILTGSVFASMFSSGRGGVTVGELIPYSTPTPMPLMGAIAPNPKKTPNPEDKRAVMGKVAPPKKKVMTEVKGEVDAPVVERKM
jgi:hypothetical protein